MIRIPEVTLPRPLAAVVGRLPRWPHSAALAAALNAAVGLRVLPRDELSPLAGRVLRVSVADAGIVAAVCWDGGRFRTAGSDDPADLAFMANAAAYLQMLMRQEDPDTLFFDRRLVVEGDTALGLFAKNLLDRIELPGWLLNVPHRG